MLNRAGEIDVDFIAFVYRGVEIRALDDGQAGIDRVAVKRPRKRTGNHSLNAESHDRRDRLFSRTATAEIPAGDKDLEVAKLLRESVAEHLEGVLCQLFRIDVNQLAAGDDDIGVDVVSEFVDRTTNVIFHDRVTSRGSEITPFSADAASVAGLHK